MIKYILKLISRSIFFSISIFFISFIFLSGIIFFGNSNFKKAQKIIVLRPAITYQNVVMENTISFFISTFQQTTNQLHKKIDKAKIEEQKLRSGEPDLKEEIVLSNLISENNKTINQKQIYNKLKNLNVWVDPDKIEYLRIEFNFQSKLDTEEETELIITSFLNLFKKNLIDKNLREKDFTKKDFIFRISQLDKLDIPLANAASKAYIEVFNSMWNENNIRKDIENNLINISDKEFNKLILKEVYVKNYNFFKTKHYYFSLFLNFLISLLITLFFVQLKIISKKKINYS